MEKSSRNLVLPPNQTITGKFPIVGEKEIPLASQNLEDWRLNISGLIEIPHQFRYDDILSYSVQRLATDVHCVTGWTRQHTIFGGFKLERLLELSKPKPEAKFVRFISYSGHDTSLPLETAISDTWIIHKLEGKDLPSDHGGPVRTVTIGLYFYKGIKWLHEIELLHEDRLGRWERDSYYHNVGDPLKEQRFDGVHLPQEGLVNFKQLEDFSRHREKVYVGLDLRRWAPRTKNLGRLQIKGSDFSYANLEGADFSGANFSLSNFSEANLRGANFYGADLEGVNFIAADLSDAKLDNTALLAVRFFDESKSVGARVKGMTYHGANGLLELQERYLREST